MNPSEKSFRPVSYLILFLGVICEAEEIKPNIIMIVADDLGFNDVSIHGSDQIPTPNIDALGIMGIQLNRLYTAPACTPSRASLLTGKYPSNVGMQHGVIDNDSPWGLGLEEKTIADYLRSGGYSTHLIGKWNLGSHEKLYSPVFRGFDSYYGYIGGMINYYNHSLKFRSCSTGYDMRKNMTVDWDSNGQYATDLFTDKAIDAIQNHDKNQPIFLMLAHLAVHVGNAGEHGLLQAPEDEIKKFSHIQDEGRRIYAAMVSKVDESVGRVVKSLHDNNMLDNSVILFMSDNGALPAGPGANHGSNFPFRGQKKNLWEGGVRSTAAIWSPLLKRRQRISKQLLHISDWLPTFVSLAGVEVTGQIDGMNVWDALSQDLPSPRKNVLILHDEATPFMAYVDNNFKILSGSIENGSYDGWLSQEHDKSQQNIEFGETYSDSILSSDVGQLLSKYSMTDSEQISKNEIDDLRMEARITCNGHHTPPDAKFSNICDPFASPCLFDILDDPCETTDLASEFPDIVDALKKELDYYGSIAEPIRNKPADSNSDPANFGGVWTWWYDELNIQEEK